MFVVWRRLKVHNARRFSSASASVVHSLSYLSHQSRVHFQASDSSRTNVEIVPVLSADEFALRVLETDKSIDIQNLFDIEKESASHSIDVTRVCITKKYNFDANVQLLVPHTVALNLAVANGGVILKNKLEGDVKVVLGCGDIQLDKVRGDTVNLTTNGGKIDVLTLVEGKTVRFNATESVTCKRLMANNAEIILGKGEISNSVFGAIYASTCNFVSRNQSGQSKLRIGNVHGYLRVSSQGLESIDIDSVTGALDIEDSGNSCNVMAHFDSWTNQMASNILVGGDVHVSLHPSASINVELHGVQVTTGKDTEFVNSEMDTLDENYAIFTGELCAQKTAKDMSSGSTGKINVDSAKDDAMRTSFFMNKITDLDETEVKASRLFVHSLSGD
ncbi:uncharacterized protein PHALS_03283 [Plasmopara halstedii]|uniref:Adhesin domain-containing protein n=1 Tax=Plasmopara halstedii TaxID=4781 RepID=A0A0N7L7C3_PLAHL|nr:uncharacterized protein PHALS_03283 [Plasmopara halstedii]CEG46675.1 hypothetical protein PHALS_03283 [Plasmopara halstedii]|eukprot:XP_024583044.1 hypothetical protein PHALS_03283 [Plasmopara halstedii]